MVFVLFFLIVGINTPFLICLVYLEKSIVSRTNVQCMIDAYHFFYLPKTEVHSKECTSLYVCIL